MGSKGVGNSSFDAANSARPSKAKKGRLLNVGRLARKYWYVILLVVVILIAIFTWLFLSSKHESAWEQAADYFGRAEYEKAAGLIGDFSIPKDEDRQRVYAQTMQATGEIDKALDGYKALYESTGDTTVKMSMGNIYNQKQEYDKASAIYEEIIADNTSNVQAYVNLATVYRLQSKKSEAVSISKEAVANNPRNVTLLELQVSMLMEDKDSPEYHEAVKALREVSPEDPLLEALEQ